MNFARILPDIYNSFVVSSHVFALVYFLFQAISDSWHVSLEKEKKNRLKLSTIF